MPASSTRASATPQSSSYKLGTTCTVRRLSPTAAPWRCSDLTQRCESNSPRSRAGNRHGRPGRKDAGQRCPVARHRHWDGSKDREERGGRALSRRWAGVMRRCAPRATGKLLTDADLVHLFRKEAPEARQVFNNGPGSVLTSVQYRANLSGRTAQRPGRLLVGGLTPRRHRMPSS